MGHVYQRVKLAAVGLVMVEIGDRSAGTTVGIGECDGTPHLEPTP